MLYLKLYEEYVDKQSISSFILDFGIFITMNLAKVEDESLDSHSKQELTTMLNELRKPLINGKNYTELTTDINKLMENPKLLSGIFLQIRNLLTYIEPRLQKFVKNSNKKNIWLDKVKNFKERYLDIIKAPIK